jgi:AGZA family xanthine/uracil permease-like MFS transporter
VNAFFGLMLDNMTQIVILAGILINIFGYSESIVLERIIPGTAIGVLFGDIVYTWMAVRLARREGRSDVTAMPLGIDTPSLFGLTFGVLGPALRATGDEQSAWQIGMAVMVVMGVLKVGCAYASGWVRRVVPRAGLLGSIAAVAILLIAFLPTLKLFAEPVVGFLSLSIVLACLVARIRLPAAFPGAFLAAALGTIAFYLLGAAGLTGHPLPSLGEALKLHPAWPLPTLGFLEGLVASLPYLPIALPFALATALFIGLGGFIGYLSFFVTLIPEAAVASILIFIGIEICAQAFQASPDRHAPAVALSFLPVIASLLVIHLGSVLSNVGADATRLTGETAATYKSLHLLSGGFIFSALLWGGALALIIDGLLVRAALFLSTGALASLFGVIHSPLPGGEMFLPWRLEDRTPLSLCAGYLVFALVLVIFHLAGWRPERTPAPDPPPRQP